MKITKLEATCPCCGEVLTPGNLFMHGFCLKKENEMTKSYMYHEPSEEGLEKVKILRNLYSALDNAVREQSPDTRERAIALTQLEQSAMWAIKAVVVNDPESVVEE